MRVGGSFPIGKRGDLAEYTERTGRVDETCVPDLTFGGFSSGLDLAAETKAELTRAFGYSTGYKLYSQQEHLHNVPSLSTSSGFEHLLPNSASLGNSSLRSSLAHLPDFSNADEAARPAARPLMDGEVPEMEVDSRNGSPCRQAAAELMEPAGSDFTERTHSLEFSPSFSHSLREQYDRREMGPQHGLAGRRSNEDRAAEQYPACLPLPPLPDLSKQPDWFTAVVEQAQSVGLWGGRPVERKPPRGPPDSERPILPDHLLSRAATGVGDRQPADASPPLAYAWGMASFLAMQQERQAAMQSQGQPASLGHFPQPQQMPDGQIPRFQPVSLGMPAVYMQPGQFAASRKPGMNDGPFRPPTRALPGTQSAGNLDFSNTPVLRQSKMQLSLGLGSDHAIDLKHWGYGGPCSGEPSERAGSKATDELRGVPQASKGVPVSLCVTAAADAPAHSASTNAGSAPTSPSARRRAEPAAPCLPMAQDGSMGSPPSHKRKGEAAEAGDVQSKSLECVSRSLGGDEASIRAECLERYREKKQRRLFCKTIRYHKRKVNADKRPRIKGRFLKATTEGSGEAKAEEQPALSGSLNEAQDTLGSDCAADRAGGKTEAAAGESAAGSEM